MAETQEIYRVESIGCDQIGVLSGGRLGQNARTKQTSFGIEGTSPTIHTFGGGGQEIKIAEPKVVGGIGEKKSNGGTQWYQQDRIYDGDCAISLATGFNPYHNTNYRIRKLTPKECFRLMGFDDEDFDKCKAIGVSDSQLYKQAGNSIVVNVLEEIFKKMF